jgi:multidrug efflux system outer membrane protein
MNRLLPLLVITSTLCACSLAPELKQPEMDIPATYKEQPANAQMPEKEGEWQPAQDAAQAALGEWWKIFGDEQLNMLEQQAIDANNTLKAAAARVETARAAVRANAMAFLPEINLGANAVRAQPAAAGVAAFGGAAGTQLKPYTLYSAQGVATYEADLFGRVHDEENAFRFEEAGSEADFRNVLLALQADVAQQYFTLRELDTEHRLLRDTLAIRQEGARIMQLRFNAGEVGDQDQARAQSELATVSAELIAVQRARATAEHALAVLLGKMPSEFMFPESPLAGAPPRIPAGLPSVLLERRPDIAKAQAAMAAANARIGVARTAFFPRIILTASGGYESTQLSDLFLWSSRSWALGQLAGSAITLPIFNNGRNIAQLDAAHALYEAAVADYRQQVLLAFKDVEDNLASQRLLAGQSRAQDDAAAAATRATALIDKRFQEGDADFFELVNAQRDSLTAERAAVQTRGQRFITTITLIRALGGGWNAAELVQAPPPPPPQPTGALSE